LTADLYNIGLTDQTNVDFSEVVIRGMRTKYEGLGARWEVMDVRDLKFEPHSFDIAIDKATMDSMFYGSMWDPPDEVRHNIKTYLNEVERILVPQGLFLYITYRQPHFIRPLLARDTWDLKHEVIPDREGGVFEYFAYTEAEQGDLTGHKAVE
jgi:SAM-dependent methyltransferase